MDDPPYNRQRHAARFPLHTMKSIIPSACAIAILAAFTACDRKPQTVGEKVEDKVKDATDQRPGEKVRDAAEDTKDAVKDATR